MRPFSELETRLVWLSFGDLLLQQRRHIPVLEKKKRGTLCMIVWRRTLDDITVQLAPRPRIRSEAET